MFGYIRVDDPYLYKKDDVLYNSIYCSVCKCIGSSCGQMARLSLTYDIAFLSVFAHNILDCDVEIKKRNCIAHWFRKRPIANKDKISLLTADINLILAYYKVQDDIIDSKKGKFKSLLLKKGYKRACKRHPKINFIVKTQYEKLRKLEIENSDSLDMVSDPFATMLMQISEYLFGEKATSYTSDLFYNIGKWIYLIDAVDDYEKDIKKGSYNPLKALYGDKDFKEIIRADNTLICIFNAIFNSIKNDFENIEFRFNTDLIKNILFNGLGKKTTEIFDKEKKIEKNL